MYEPVVAVTLRVPKWASDFLEAQADNLISDYEASEVIEATKDTLPVIICDNVASANAAVEKFLDEYGIPYDKHYDGSIEWDRGEEWVRYDVDGNKVHRDVQCSERPDCAAWLKDYQEWRVTLTETLAAKRIVSRLQIWWDDNKPLEPPIQDCVLTQLFIDKTKQEA